MQENKWVFFLNIVYNGATTTTINYTVQTGAVKESKRKRNKCVSVTHKATGSQRIGGFLLMRYINLRLLTYLRIGLF